MHSAKRVAIAAFLIVLCSGKGGSAADQGKEPERFFREFVGLTDDQIKDIRAGKAVAKTLDSGSSDEVFVFGSVFVKSTPERYLELASDIDSLRETPNYLAIEKFSDPPQASDLAQFTLDESDIKELQHCRPGHCEVQLPTEAMEEFKARWIGLLLTGQARRISSRERWR